MIAVDNEPADMKITAKKIAAKINPPFRGWFGKTVFHLDNGRVWQQRLKGRYAYDGGDNSVVISRNLLGYYKMALAATGKGEGVERIR